MPYVFMVLAILGSVVGASPAAAQESVMLIRHAEKEAGADPHLTESGRDRARRWAEMMRDSGISAVITSNFQRTRETGGIIAEALGIERSEVEANDVAGLLDILGFDHEDDRVLIVGHTNTIPAIISGLGVADTVTIGEDDFANLFVVTPIAGGGGAMIRLRMP